MNGEKVVTKLGPGLSLLTVLLCGCAGSVVPAPQAPVKPPKKEEPVKVAPPRTDYDALDLLEGVQRRVLDNGLTVLVKEDHRLPVATVVTSYRVGSVHEPSSTSGLAHFLEHMLFKGTDTIGKGEIDRITMKCGGTNNAYTDNDYTQYWFSVSSDTVGEVLRIEASRMRNSTLDRKEFDEERKVVLEELYRNWDTPWGRLHYDVDQVVFRSHSYRRPGLGFEEDLKSVPWETMRDFYRDTYGPNNATLVVVGDVKAESVFTKVRELFDAIPRVKEAVPPTPPEPPQDGERRHDIESDLSLDRIAVAFRSDRVGSDEDYALDALQQILTTGKDSRLYKRLVVKDRTAGSVEAWNNARRYDGVFYVFAEVGEKKSPKDVERAIVEELETLKQKPIPARELQKAKNILTAGFVFAKETTHSLAGDIAAREALGAPEYLRTYLARIKALTPEAVMAAAQRVFRPENRTVALSRAKEERRPSHREPSTVAPAAEFGEYHEHRLENGLTLLIKPRKGLPIVSVQAYVDAGPLREPASRAGVATLTGRMLDQGFEAPDGRRMTAEEIAEAVEYTGAVLETSAEGLHFKVLTRDVPLAFDFLRDLLRHPSFPKDRVGLHRELQLKEIQAVGDSPPDLARERFLREVYAGHPAERPANGLQETVEKLTREDVVAHHRAFYRPENVILAVAGDVEPEAVLAQIRARFAEWRGAEGAVVPGLPSLARQLKARTIVHFRKTNQIHVIWGHLSVPPDHPDFFALRVLEYVFCRSPGFVDRLSRIVREELHLAYEAHGRMTHLEAYPAPFAIYIGSGSSNGLRARDASLDILRDLLKEGPKQEELETARSYLMRNIPFSWEAAEDLAEYMITLRRLRLGIDWPLRYRRGIASVTREDVLRAARTHLSPDHLTTVIVGPVDQEGRVVDEPKKEDGNR